MSMSMYVSSTAYWEAQAEKNEKDAERYRWLRDAAEAHSVFSAAYFNTSTSAEMDAAIDAAMASTPAVGDA